MKSMTAALVLLMALCAGCGKNGATTAESPASSQEQAPKGSVIAAGASLTVRTTSSLSTATVKSGDAFSANLEVPLRSGDRVLVPKGAPVEGRIVVADPGGRTKGRAHISVQLSEMQAAGQIVRVSTNTIHREARATKGKDAAKIGIGAGIGAAIGAIAGGGKGAAIGAGAGGAAGTGVVLATRGDPAVIPSESVLIFELRSPLTIPSTSN